jgi:hypothetical protein
MSEFEPYSFDQQVDRILQGSVNGGPCEYMTSDVVGDAGEAVDYVLHDAQLEIGAPLERSDLDADSATTIIERAIRNNTFAGLLRNDSDTA